MDVGVKVTDELRFRWPTRT